MPGTSRRKFMSTIPAALALSGKLSIVWGQTLTEKARVSARPSKASGSIAAGLHPLGLRGERDSLL
jgi:hypothetical protein